MTKKLVIKKKTIKDVPKRQRQNPMVRGFTLHAGLPSLTMLRVELQDMTDVLMGRQSPPIDAGLLTLMEVADAFYSRAKEIERLIHQGESEGDIPKGGSYYKFRTGELRDFYEMAKAATELGSRRITAEDLNFKQSTYGRESA